jgi:hypothetical protein
LHCDAGDPGPAGSQRQCNYLTLAGNLYAAEDDPGAVDVDADASRADCATVDERTLNGAVEDGETGLSDDGADVDAAEKSPDTGQFDARVASGDGAGVRYSAGDAARPEGGDNGDVDAPVAGNNLSGAAVDDAAEKCPNTGQVDARVTRGNGAPVRYPPAGAAAAEDRNGAEVDAGTAGENAPGVVDAAGKRDRILYDDTAGAGGDLP